MNVTGYHVYVRQWDPLSNFRTGKVWYFKFCMQTDHAIGK